MTDTVHRVTAITAGALSLLLWSAPLVGGTAVGNREGAKEFPRNETREMKQHIAKVARRKDGPNPWANHTPAFTAYKEMTYKGLTVTALGMVPGNEGLWLVPASPRNPRRIMGGLHIGEAPKNSGALHLPEELHGQPALLTYVPQLKPSRLTFALSQPARVYAFIDWHATNHPNDEIGLWHPYRKDSRDGYSLYYRDFGAGQHTIHLNADTFVGAGCCPLSDLSEKERLVVCGVVEKRGPHLRLTSAFDAPAELDCTYTIVNPNTDAPLHTARRAVTVEPGETTLVPLMFRADEAGVMYSIRSEVRKGNLAWEDRMSWGRFPVPPDDPSVQEPIIPFGGYVKLTVNNDADIYTRFLAATFYHFRKMGMNAAMLAGDSRWDLDTAARYKIKCVVRGNRRQIDTGSLDEIMDHPALLTVAVGDEPKIDDEIEQNLETYRNLNEKYPDLLPITCTIYDGYGTGGSSDPVLLHNWFMRDVRCIRFGRYYCFRKDHYGLLWSSDYKFMLPVPAVFQGLEANADKPWWLAPPFFGKLPTQNRPRAYWRIPTGLELKALLHDALAHRCTGIIGWGTHTHGNVTGSFFDGQTMARSPYWPGKEMTEFGQQLMRAKDVLLNFTPVRVPVAWRSTMEIDPVARWLNDGRFAVYVVNLDVQNPHAPELRIPLDAPGAFEQIGSITNVFTGARIPFEQHVDSVPETGGEKGFLRIRVPELAPADAALLLVSPNTKTGTFDHAPDEIKQHVQDQDFIEADF